MLSRGMKSQGMRTDYKHEGRKFFLFSSVGFLFHEVDGDKERWKVDMADPGMGWNIRELQMCLLELKMKRGKLAVDSFQD